MTEPTVATGIEEVKALVGRSLGYSDWHEVTQEQVNLFADATGDHQWIHTDPDRAQDGPFGTTIAHGFLTLSLIPMMLPKILRFEGFSMGVNYGLNRVRFPAPVPVGSKVRATAVVDEVTEIKGGVQTRITVTFEVEGGSKPVCVAESLVRQYV